MTRRPSTPRKQTATEPRPLLALRSTLLLPRQALAVQMGAERNVALARSLTVPGDEVIVVVAPEGDGDSLGQVAGRIGVLCRVRERSEPSPDTVQLTLFAIGRVLISDVFDEGPFSHAAATDARDVNKDDFVARELAATILGALDELVDVGVGLDPAILPVLRAHADAPGQLADLAAAHLDFRVEDRDEVVQRLDVVERLRFVAARVEKEAARAQVAAEVLQ